MPTVTVSRFVDIGRADGRQSAAFVVISRTIAGRQPVQQDFFDHADEGSRARNKPEGIRARTTS